MIARYAHLARGSNKVGWARVAASTNQPVAAGDRASDGVVAVSLPLHRWPCPASASTASTRARERRNSRAIAAGLRPASKAARISFSCPCVTGAGLARALPRDVLPACRPRLRPRPLPLPPAGRGPRRRDGAASGQGRQAGRARPAGDRRRRLLKRRRPPGFRRAFPSRHPSVPSFPRVIPYSRSFLSPVSASRARLPITARTCRFGHDRGALQVLVVRAAGRPPAVGNTALPRSVPAGGKVWP